MAENMRFPLCQFCLMLMLFSAPSFSQDLSPEQETSLRSFISSVMECKATVGMSVSLVRGGHVIFAEGFGYRDLEKNSVMENHTKINIGSITKSFTATLAADLVGRDLVNWETPLVDILGEDFQLEGPYRTEQACLRDILSHRLGMPSYWGVIISALNVSREDLCMSRLRHFTSYWNFRSQYLYCNQGYILAGYLTEVLSGVTWEDGINILFNQLGMNDTKHAADLDETDWNTNTAYSYVTFDGQFRKNPEEDLLPAIIFANPAGGIYTTANDMGKYMLFHLSKGMNEDGEQLIPELVMNQLYGSVNSLEAADGFRRPTYPVEDAEYTYGLGFKSGTYRGINKVAHTGSYNSYNCRMNLLPEVDVGAWVCVNSPGDDRSRDAILVTNLYALDLLLDEEPWLNETTACTFPSPWEPEVARPKYDAMDNYNADVVKNSNNVNLPLESSAKPRQIEEYVGEYGHPGFGTFYIFINETGHLKCEYGLLLKGHLTESDDSLLLYMTVEYPLDFNQHYYPGILEGSPLFFGTDVPDGPIETVTVPYLEFLVPPVFRRGFSPVEF